VWFRRKLSPLVVTLLSEEATGSVVEANLDPRNSPSNVPSLRYVGGVPDRAIVRECVSGSLRRRWGPSLTGEKHVPRGVDEHLLPERQPKTFWN
jgi:hypothetical protein